MKNININKILVIVVAFIWGFIIFRIIWGTGSSESEFSTPQQKVYKNTVVAEDIFTYSLLANYQDPFLKRISGKRQQNFSVRKNRQTQRKSSVSTRRRTGQKKKQVSWPDISYTGFMERKDESIAVIKIDGKSRYMKQGDKLKGVKILTLSKDSVILEFNDVKKTYYK